MQGADAGKGAARIHAFGAFEVDERLYELRRSGVEVALRRKSFEVLVYLIRNAERVISKEELLDRVWPGTSVSETSLANCVSEIRAALGDRRESASAVQTVYGRGYRFVARLVDTRPPASHAPAGALEAPPAAGRSARHVFVGRQRALERLGRALDRSFEGSGNVALLLGESGIGKTRLAERFAEAAAARRASVLRVRCERDGLSLESCVEMLRDRLDGEGAAARAPGAGAGEPDALRRQLRDLLLELSRRTACVVVFDDLQHADADTLSLVRCCAREMRRQRVLLLGTLDAIPRRPDHPLTRLVAELKREAAAETIEVAPLAEPEVEEFVAQVRGGAPSDRALVSAIVARTEGHPLFLRELVELLEDEGWSGADAAGAIPAGVRATIQLRLERLQKSCRRLLEIAAAGGREFGPTLLQRVSQVDPLECLDELERALDAGIVCESTAGDAGAGSYRFVHGIVREVLYEGLGARDRVEIHRRYAAELEARQADPGEIARHLARSNEPADLERSVEFAARAARRFARRGAHDQAAAHYEAALSTLAELGAPDPRRRCDLQLAHAWALRWSHRYARAREVLRQAIESARALRATDQLAGAAMVWVGFDTFGTVDPAPIRLVEEALHAVPNPASALGVYLLLCRIAARWLLDTPQRTLAQSLEVIGMADRLAYREVQVGARLFLHASLRGAGQEGERRAVRDDALRIATTQPDRSVELLARAVLMGDLVEAADASAFDREIEVMERLAGHPRDPYVRSSHGLRAQLRGEVGEAERRLAPLWGDTQHAELGLPCPPGFACQLFQLRREQGRVAELEALIRSGRSQVPAAALWRALLTLLLLDSGRPDEARRELAEVFEGGVARLPRDAFWLGTLVHLAEGVSALGLKAYACELYPLLEPYGSRVAVMHSFACVDPVALALGRLAAVRGRSRRAEAHFESARALAARLRAAPSLARIERALRELPGVQPVTSLRRLAR